MEKMNVGIPVQCAFHGGAKDHSGVIEASFEGDAEDACGVPKWM